MYKLRKKLLRSTFDSPHAVDDVASMKTLQLLSCPPPDCSVTHLCTYHTQYSVYVIQYIPPMLRSTVDSNSLMNLASFRSCSESVIIGDNIVLSLNVETLTAFAVMMLLLFLGNYKIM